MSDKNLCVDCGNEVDDNDESVCILCSEPLCWYCEIDGMCVECYECYGDEQEIDEGRIDV